MWLHGSANVKNCCRRSPRHLSRDALWSHLCCRIRWVVLIPHLCVLYQFISQHCIIIISYIRYSCVISGGGVLHNIAEELLSTVASLILAWNTRKEKLSRCPGNMHPLRLCRTVPPSGVYPHTLISMLPVFQSCMSMRLTTSGLHVTSSKSQIVGADICFTTPVARAVPPSPFWYSIDTRISRGSPSFWN